MSTDHMDLRLAAQRTMPKQIINTADLRALVDAYDALLVAGQPKRKAAAKKAAAAPVGALPGWLPLEAWEAFLAMRVKIKKPATDYAQKLLLKKLAAFVAQGIDPQIVLDQSITSGWQDLYAPKNDQQRGFGYDPAPAHAGQRFQPQLSVAEQNARNSIEAMRMLGIKPDDDPEATYA